MFSPKTTSLADNFSCPQNHGVSYKVGQGSRNKFGEKMSMERGKGDYNPIYHPPCTDGSEFLHQLRLVVCPSIIYGAETQSDLGNPHHVQVGDMFHFLDVCVPSHP